MAGDIPSHNVSRANLELWALLCSNQMACSCEDVFEGSKVGNGSGKEKSEKEGGGVNLH